MKRSGLLILLVSVGLNLGFVWHMWRTEAEPSDLHPRHGSRWSEMHDRHWPAKGDTAAWRTMGHRRLDRVTARLELDPGQAEAFRRTQQETVKRLAGKRTLVSDSRARLRALMAEDVIDSVAVRTTLFELGRRQAVLDSLVAESFMAEMAVLDPEQRAHYLRMMPFGGGAGPGNRSHRGRGGSHD